CQNLLHICCDGEECLLTKEAECEDLDGEWHPDYDSCEIDTVSCGDPLRVCCVQGEAYPKLLWEAECDILSGEWHEEWESLDPDPCLPALPEVCCLESNECLIVTPDSCATLGGYRESSLTVCDPNPCPGRLRACCLESGGCFLITETACGGILGAEWHEDESSCDPNPCPQPPTDAVCCAEDATGSNVCMVVSEDLCESFDGQWHPSLHSCTGINCDVPLRACCVEDSCSLTWESECGAMGGTYLENENSCDPNPCPDAIRPRMTWGRIKALYRSQKQQKR
ncbi:MAG: hypothetical protein KAY24_14005, partial [Candidatus Eisenbacteria sp.]|nr:hypothetical protein [Candidatus Eisenbacteria bacterium]